MAITHIVFFKFKPEANSDAVKDVAARMLALKDQCIHPVTQKPYIVCSKGGRDNSIEGLQDNVSHAFVVEFESAEDRDYYVQKDPAHLAFVKTLEGLLDKAHVVDFTDGVL